MEMFASTEFWLAVGQIIMIDILLGGDNAVVIALACRKLAPAQRTKGILWGTAGAIVLRIVLIFFALQLLAIPFLKTVGALLLIWIGVKLLMPEHDDGHADIEGSDRLWGAVKTVIVADLVMSIDNVIAVAGAAEASGTGHGMVLVIFGVVVSIPIIVWGSQMVIKLMDRFPVVITLGGMLLGWIAGTMVVSDPALVSSDVLPQMPKLDVSDAMRYGAGIAGALLVLLLGRVMTARAAKARAPAVAVAAAAAGPGRLQRILLAVDGSEAAARAARHVIGMQQYLRDPKAQELHLINVQRPVSERVSTHVGGRSLEQYHREESEKAVAPIRKLLDGAGLDYALHERVGAAGETIAREAQQLSCDMIVMGTKGVGAAAALLGSVAQSTIAAAAVPVLLVK